MNRVQAYKLLISEMELIAGKSVAELKEISGTSLHSDVSTENGTRYSISVDICSGGEGAYLLKGSIHDNSSFKYDLLEEKMQVEK
jgi:hypothetical protein